MVEVRAQAAVRRNRRQAEEVFQAQGDAHKTVIFHLGQRDKGVGLTQSGRKLVLGKHDPAARHLVALKGRVASLDVFDAEFLQDRPSVEIVARALARRREAGIEREDLRVAALPQKPQRGPHHVVVHQFLPPPADSADAIGAHLHVDLDADSPRLFDLGPRPVQGRGDFHQSVVDLIQRRLVATVGGADGVVFLIAHGSSLL